MRTLAAWIMILICGMVGFSTYHAAAHKLVSKNEPQGLAPGENGEEYLEYLEADFTHNIEEKDEYVFDTTVGVTLAIAKSPTETFETLPVGPCSLTAKPLQYFLGQVFWGVFPWELGINTIDEQEYASCEIREENSNKFMRLEVFSTQEPGVASVHVAGWWSSPAGGMSIMNSPSHHLEFDGAWHTYPYYRDIYTGRLSLGDWNMKTCSWVLEGDRDSIGHFKLDTTGCGPYLYGVTIDIQFPVLMEPSMGWKGSFDLDNIALTYDGPTTSGNLTMKEHVFDLPVELRKLSIDAVLPGDSMVEVSIYAAQSNESGWEKIGVYPFTANNLTIQFPDGLKAQKVKYGMSGSDGIRLIPDDNRNVPFLRSLTLSVESPQPIILIHGWQGLSLGNSRNCNEGIGRLDEPGVVNTFGEMASWFKDDYDVWIAHYDTSFVFTPSYQQNAVCLQGQIAKVREKTGRRSILVAHSMGGLVGRACLGLIDCKRNVSDLYTIGSPHAGVNLEIFIRVWDALFGKGYSQIYCQSQPGACQFDPYYMIVHFNIEYPTQNEISYTFLGGDNTPFPSGILLFPTEGLNDGIVGKESAVGRTNFGGDNVIHGPDPGRYWTHETHLRFLGTPSYFDPFQGKESQAFRCLYSLMEKKQPTDCEPVSDLKPSIASDAEYLEGTTIDISGTIFPGQVVSHTLQIDTQENSLFYISWLTGTLNFTLTRPDGIIISPLFAKANPGVTVYIENQSGDDMPPFASYAFTDTLPGVYTLTLSSGTTPDLGSAYIGFAALETDRFFWATTDKIEYQVGDTATITATLKTLTGGIVGANVQAELFGLDGALETMPLRDLSNGRYSLQFAIPNHPGSWWLKLTAIGDDADIPFTRQTSAMIRIIPDWADIWGAYRDYLLDEDGDGISDTLTIDIGLIITQTSDYILTGDLITNGQVIAHAAELLQGIHGVQIRQLKFEGSDIYRSQVNGPFYLMNVRLSEIRSTSLSANTAWYLWTTKPYSWLDFGSRRIFLPILNRQN